MQFTKWIVAAILTYIGAASAKPFSRCKEGHSYTDRICLQVSNETIHQSYHLDKKKSSKEKVLAEYEPYGQFDVNYTRYVVEQALEDSIRTLFHLHRANRFCKHPAQKFKNFHAKRNDKLEAAAFIEKRQAERRPVVTENIFHSTKISSPRQVTSKLQHDTGRIQKRGASTKMKRNHRSAKARTVLHDLDFHN